MSRLLSGVAPRGAGAAAIPHRPDEAAVVCRCPANIAFAARQKILDPIPLVIAQPISTPRLALQLAGRL